MPYSLFYFDKILLLCKLRIAFIACALHFEQFQSVSALNFGVINMLSVYKMQKQMMIIPFGLSAG